MTWEVNLLDKRNLNHENKIISNNQEIPNLEIKMTFKNLKLMIYSIQNHYLKEKVQFER